VSKAYPKYDKYSEYDKKKKPSLYNRIGIFFQNTKRIIKIANKPDRKEYFTIFKICAIGIVLLGAVSYVIQLIFTLVNSALGIGL
jgi:protein translocase SEC61 complex gamma subunit